MRFRFSRLFLILIVFALSSAAPAQKERTIGEVQGDKNASPFDGQTARLSGIVTARLKDGFFIQSPDDKTDANPATSEGIYVFTGSEMNGGEAALGNLVTVSGNIIEFRPKSEPSSLPITELSMKKGVDSVTVVSKDNALPKPVILTAADFRTNQIDQLEKYEGMRVQINQLTTVSPTNGRVDAKNATAVSDGVFYVVLKGFPRPFRSAGMDVHDYYFSKDRDELKKIFPRLPLFDSNPEVLRIDSAEQLGAQTMDVTSRAEIRNLVGVMHYGYRKYTILPDATAKPEISNSIKPTPLPAPTDRQFSVAGMNLENFFDNEDDPSIKEDVLTIEGFEKRLKKVSMAVRDYMSSPDVIGIIEVESLPVLKKLADRINADAVAAGQPNPKYAAYLMDGNDGRGIDVGFLVKSARVNVVEVKQLGKDTKIAGAKVDENLHDRPPFLLKATIVDSKTNQPFAFTVVVNHLKSLLGYETERVRVKKKTQAEDLAKFVQERQKADRTERIVLIGDFNAFQFPDGVLDVIGTIKGAPASKEQVQMASEDLVNPDMTDLVDLIKEDQRYSYIYDGNAQTLDHFLVTDSMKKHLAGFGFARLNADFPETYRGDAARAERFSDHDPAIAYFSFDAKTAAAAKAP